MASSKTTDVLAHNRRAWNAAARGGENIWCQPVDAARISRAREGDCRVLLTPCIDVPRAWLGELRDKEVLCLASGGGQQAPLLAAAGARVTSFDNSEEQLALDQQVARREGLALSRVQGDMADLACFDSARFDLIFHPVSNVFAEAVRPVWRECSRVLRSEGRLLAGFMNPDYFLFDHDELEAGADPTAVHRLPYTDLDHLGPEELAARAAAGIPVEFSHSLEAQIGGQLEAGLLLAGFYEDRWTEDATPLSPYLAVSLATLAFMPRASGI